MKNKILLCLLVFLLLMVHKDFAQEPTGPGGTPLYKKSCETASAGAFFCTYCTDKDGTTGCHDYICDGSGNCKQLATPIPPPSSGPKGAISSVQVSNGIMLVTRNGGKDKELIATYKPGYYVSVSYSSSPTDISFTKTAKGDLGSIVESINYCIAEYNKNNAYDLVMGIKKKLATISTKVFIVKKY